MQNDKCPNCQHSTKHPSQLGTWLCSRFPPQMVAVQGPGGAGLVPVMPAVTENHSCGEFAARPEAVS